MLYIALVDDNPYDLSELAGHLASLKTMGIRAEVISYSSGLDLIADCQNGRRFHLIVLDMLMEVIDGIETARRIRKLDSSVPLLIVTGTVQYALEGYTVNAWRYLMKPVDHDVFLKEVVEILTLQEKSSANHFIVSNESGITKVKLDDILYFESELHTIKLVTITSEHLFRGAMYDIESRLKTENFLRVHKSFIVNMKYVKNIFKNELLMENGARVLISKHKSHDFYEKLMNYTEKTYGRTSL